MKTQAPRPWFVRWLETSTGNRNDRQLTTTDLVLRPPRMQDAVDFHAYARDPLVARFVLWEPHTNLAQTRAALRGLIADNRLDSLHSMSLVRKTDGRMVGTIGLVARDWQNNSAEVGFSLARDCWGQGLMSQALLAYLHFAFTSLQLNRVEAQHDLNNPASGRVMEKAGMLREGLLKERLHYKGRYADIALYAALQKTWLDAYQPTT